jgi:hypothetical protein
MKSVAKTTVALPKGVISPEGIRQIRIKLEDESIRLPVDWEWVAKVGGKGEFVGSFAKRVAKYAHVYHNKRLHSDFLGVIGSLVSQHTATESVYTYDITRRIEWSAGDFGDSGSCYWGCRSGARTMIEENNGGAVRLYRDTGRGYARCWITPHGDGYVIWNGYGETTATFANIVSAIFSMPYKRVSLSNQGSDTNTLWINGGFGYYVAENAPEFNGEIDLGWDEIEGEDDRYTCCNCGDSVDNDDVIMIRDEPYCCDCANVCYSCCCHCGDWVDHDDIVNVDDDYYCTECADRRFTRCDICGEYHKDGFMEIDDKTVCSSCFENGNYYCCEGCEEYHEYDNGTDVNGNRYCDDCLADLPVCADCEDEHSGLTMVDGRPVCEGCLANYDYSEEWGVYVPKGQTALEIVANG